MPQEENREPLESALDSGSDRYCGVAAELGTVVVCGVVFDSTVLLGGAPTIPSFILNA